MNYKGVTEVSVLLWKSGGRQQSHSRDRPGAAENKTERWVIKASHNIKTNIITANTESREPKEDTWFHL